MLSIGWTEMMLVAAVALIVVGPRDLPAMLRQIGKAVGSVRKMGNEFKAELNKITAVDEIRDIKRSIAAPLTDTRASIEKEFNSISKTGQVVPSGKIKPADPNAQSVVDEIRAAAGMGGSLEENGAAAKASIATAVTKAAQDQPVVNEQSAKDASPVVAASKPKRARAKPKSAGAKNPAAKAKAASSKKPATAKSTASKSSAAKPTPRKTGTRKSATTKPTAKSAAAKSVGTKSATRKPAARKSAARKSPAPKNARTPAGKANG